MEIIRNGEKYRLTSAELRAAYYEQQFLFDRDDIVAFAVEPLTEEEFVDTYGVTKAEFPTVLDAAARRLRHDLDRYDDCPYTYARDAVAEAISEKMHNKVCAF